MVVLNKRINLCLLSLFVSLCPLSHHSILFVFHHQKAMGKLTIEERSRLVGHLQAIVNIFRISNVNKTIVWRINRKLMRTGSVKTCDRNGRPPKTTRAQDIEMYFLCTFCNIGFSMLQLSELILNLS